MSYTSMWNSLLGTTALAAGAINRQLTSQNQADLNASEAIRNKSDLNRAAARVADINEGVKPNNNTSSIVGNISSRKNIEKTLHDSKLTAQLLADPEKGDKYLDELVTGAREKMADNYTEDPKEVSQQISDFQDINIVDKYLGHNNVQPTNEMQQTPAQKAFAEYLSKFSTQDEQVRAIRERLEALNRGDYNE